MNDLSFKILTFTIINVLMFGAVYLYGYRYHPKLALWLCVATAVVMMIACYYSGAFLLFSLVFCMAYLFILKKPDQTTAFKTLYAKHHVFTSKKISAAALEILGDKNWHFAEASVIGITGKTNQYLFWQGYLKSTVSSGQYTRSTVYTHYIAFIFPPGSVSNAFKQVAKASADKSGYTRWDKFKFFFKHDTEKPNLVTVAPDGTLIMQFLTLQDAEHYARRFDWIKENIGITYYPVTAVSFGNN